jgi:hypothetical protein
MDEDGIYWLERLRRFTAHVRAVRNRCQEVAESTGDPRWLQVSRDLSDGIGNLGADEPEPNGLVVPGGRVRRRNRA